MLLVVDAGAGRTLAVSREGPLGSEQQAVRALRLLHVGRRDRGHCALHPNGRGHARQGLGGSERDDLWHALDPTEVLQAHELGFGQHLGSVRGSCSTRECSGQRIGHGQATRTRRLQSLKDFVLARDHGARNGHAEAGCLLGQPRERLCRVLPCRCHLCTKCLGKQQLHALQTGLLGGRWDVHEVLIVVLEVEQGWGRCGRLAW
mmetsp:Transcript_65654/g.211841  ORF Transcript_65654/g.211841 Transcript_65654/m.211841 type:complete len:204 (+) Transcript_65654:272-883(+)